MISNLFCDLCSFLKKKLNHWLQKYVGFYKNIGGDKNVQVTFKICTKWRSAKSNKRISWWHKTRQKHQVLMGATGTGKTFTIANVIKEVNKPTLVLAHNKTLAGQLYSELKELFPENRVEYFVSYYDYYQPEAYVPSTDTYIEKDASINDEIDELRHSATSAYK